jgi:hypothetical protein
MPMLKKTFLLIFACFSFISGFSQETKDDLTRLKNGEDLNVMYRHEASFGIFGHTAAGFGIGYRRGLMMNVDRKRMWEIEAQNFKHPKEVKSINPYYENAKGFVYGKLNSVLLLRSGVGLQNMIYSKSDKKSVEIRYTYFIGATIALAKPVYLEIIRPTTDPLVNVVTTEKFDPELHDPTNIYGKAPFFTGIDGTKIYPAGYAKLALSFEYADRYNGLKAIETGIIADVYPKAIPMMAFNKAQQVYVLLYLKILWGKKWF